MTRTSSDPVPSRALVEASLRGDEEALAGLLERHLPDLRTFVLVRHGRRLRELESSADVVQSVCREVLEELDRFEFRSEGGFRHWLFRVAERKLLERARFWSRQRRDPDRLEPMGDRSSTADGAPPLPAAEPTPSQHAAANEQALRMEAAYRELTEEQQEVILLTRVVGLSHREAAERMGRSEGATRTLLYRALARLGKGMRSADGSASH